MDKRCGILIVGVTILVLCTVGTAAATNWSVDGSGGADFIGIQEAINEASDGDTIIVHSGVYYENVVVDRSVTLMGIGQPVVDGSGEGSAITLIAGGITLEGFTATNSGSLWQDGGIKVTSNNNTITGNNASNNNDDGICLKSSSNNTITGNNFCNNSGGITFDYSSNNRITGNNVSNNDWRGIYLRYSSNNNNITGNNVCNHDWSGIDLYKSNNNSITANNVCNNNNWGGIILYGSSNNTITGNNASNNNDNGISLSSSSNNIITGNTFVNDGLNVWYSYQNTVEDNTVNGKPLVYLEDVSDYKVENAGQVILLNCTNITVEKQDLSKTSVGVWLLKTRNSRISNNTVCNNEEGISLSSSSNNNTITGNNASNNGDVGICLIRSSNNNTITGNNVSNNDFVGIILYGSSNNTITGNNASNNSGGITFDYSSNNTITGNNAGNNKYKGIGLSSSSNNTITGNNASNNWDGIVLSSSSNNKIYFNNFINNTNNVDSHDSINIWNSPLEITCTYGGNAYTNYVGNYWDDYEGTDAEGDGIGDTHYSIYTNTKEDESDDYPLMKPFENYNLTTSAPA